MNNLNNIDINLVLPTNLIIKSAGSHLYGFGVSLFSYGNKSRSKLFHPLIVNSVFILMVFRGIIVIMIDKTNFKIATILGAFSFFLGIKFHINMTAMIGVILVFVLNLIHYIQFIKGIKPSYMKVFDMLSGKCSPKSIGLTNIYDIYKLLNRTKFLIF